VSDAAGPTDLRFDLDSLTVGELEDLEDRLGAGLDEIIRQLQQGGRSAKLLRAIVWVTQRRTEPGFTWEQAGAVRVTEVVAPPPREAGAAG